MRYFWIAYIIWCGSFAVYDFIDGSYIGVIFQIVFMLYGIWAFMASLDRERAAKQRKLEADS